MTNKREVEYGVTLHCRAFARSSQAHAALRIGGEDDIEQLIRHRVRSGDEWKKPAYPKLHAVETLQQDIVWLRYSRKI